MADKQWDGAERRMSSNFVEERWDKVFEAIYDVRDRVTRIEEKQDVMNKRSEKVEEMSMEADRKATEALLISKDNQKDIDLIRSSTQNDINIMRSNNRWAWGIVLGLASSVVILLLTKVI